jgi:hypothetical protein
MRLELFGYELIFQKIIPGLEFVTEEEYARREAFITEKLRKLKILKQAGYPEEVYKL